MRYLPECEELRMAELLGRAVALSEALGLADGGELAELLTATLAELRALLMPATPATPATTPSD